MLELCFGPLTICDVPPVQVNVLGPLDWRTKNCESPVDQLPLCFLGHLCLTSHGNRGFQLLRDFFPHREVPLVQQELAGRVGIENRAFPIDANHRIGILGWESCQISDLPVVGLDQLFRFLPRGDIFHHLGLAPDVVAAPEKAGGKLVGVPVLQRTFLGVGPSFCQKGLFLVFPFQP